MDDVDRRSVNSDWDSLSIEDQHNRQSIDIPPIEITATSPVPCNGGRLHDVLDPFGGPSYLRVPGPISGRTSPSVASMTSEPESCIDDTRYMNEDDDIDIDNKPKVTLASYSRNSSNQWTTSGWF